MGQFDCSGSKMDLWNIVCEANYRMLHSPDVKWAVSDPQNIGNDPNLTEKFDRSPCESDMKALFSMNRRSTISEPDESCMIPIRLDSSEIFAEHSISICVKS